MTKILKVKEIVKLLKISGADPNRKVRNLLRSLEEKTGNKILFENNKHFYSTEALLRSALPEAFQEDIFTQTSLTQLKERLDTIQKTLNNLTFRLNTLEEKVTNESK